jgi:hypothetical protein
MIHQADWPSLRRHSWRLLRIGYRSLNCSGIERRLAFDIDEGRERHAGIPPRLALR